MSRNKKDLQFWESSKMNNQNYLHYYDRLMEMAISRFKWNNLPKSIDERFLELTLFGKGMCVFFKDEDLDVDNKIGEGSYLALNTIIQGRLNVYNLPIKRKAFATNGYTKDLDNTNSVIIYNSYLHKGAMKDIEIFAKQLYEIQSAITVNAKAQKTPIAILCDENERLTMVNLYKEYDGNAPFIFGSKNLDLSNIKAITTGAPYVADKLYDLKTQIWNEALTYLGISNINIVKKERLISDEVTRNLGGTMASRFSPLGMRQQACEDINDMFGLNISVDYREDFQELVESTRQEVLGEEGTGKESEEDE